MASPALPCLEAMYRDIARMLGDQETEDIALVCQGHRLMVHSFLLCARSPVFRSMLTVDMEEKRSREVHMEEAEVEVVRQLVKYLYTADISPGFGRLEELLVLANRYSVLPLVSLCSSLLAGSLTSDTALKLGVLGETHQAGELLAASARYIAGNLSSLGGDEAGDWMEAARGSPRLTAGIVEALRLGQRSSLAADLCPETARRCTYGLVGVAGQTRAHIVFSVQWVGEEGEAKPLFLVGLGLYTIPERGGKKRVTVKVTRVEGLGDGPVLACLPVDLLGAGSLNEAVQEVHLARPLALQPGSRYQLSLHIEGTGFIYSGANQLPRVEVEAAHLGRRLEVVTHQTSSPRAGNFFPRMLLKTHL